MSKSHYATIRAVVKKHTSMKAFQTLRPHLNTWTCDEPNSTWKLPRKVLKKCKKITRSPKKTLSSQVWENAVRVNTVYEDVSILFKTHNYLDMNECDPDNYLGCVATGEPSSSVWICMHSCARKQTHFEVKWTRWVDAGPKKVFQEITISVSNAIHIGGNFNDHGQKLRVTDPRLFCHSWLRYCPFKQVLWISCHALITLALIFCLM